MNKKNVDALKTILSGGTPEKQIHLGWTPDKKEFDETEWEVKNGYRVKKTKFDSIRVPMFCPSCEKVMKGSKDTNAYYSNGTCLNCLVDYHDELRKSGKLEQFMFKKRLKSARDWLSDQWKEFGEFEESLKKNPEFVLSDGTIEKWHSELNFSEIINSYKGHLEDFETKLNNSIKKYEEKYEQTIDN